MSIDSPSIPVESDQPKKKNCFLWGCLSVVVLIIVTACCVGSLVVLPLVTDFDPLNLKDRIGEYFQLEDYLDDPSQIPGLEDFFDEGFDPFQEELMPTAEISDPVTGPSESRIDASSIPLENYAATDFSAYFQYPAGWEIEVEDYAVTFYDPDSYKYLYVGEDLVDDGMTAEQVASDVMESIREEAQEGTFQLLTSTPWLADQGEDAYLTLMEWTDSDGYYTWAYDLEFVLGEYNTFFFISGEDPGEIELYGDLLEIIAESFSRQ